MKQKIITAFLSLAVVICFTGCFQYENNKYFVLIVVAIAVYSVNHNFSKKIVYLRKNLFYEIIIPFNTATICGIACFESLTFLGMGSGKVWILTSTISLLMGAASFFYLECGAIDRWPRSKSSV